MVVEPLRLFHPSRSPQVTVFLQRRNPSLLRHQIGQRGTLIIEAVALFLHHGGRGLVDEAGVGQLLVDAFDVGPQLADLLVQSRQFGILVDQARYRD